MPRRPQHGPGARGEQMEDERRAERDRARRPEARRRFSRKGSKVRRSRSNAELGGVGHQDAEHGRVQVQVQMAVDVVQRQAGGAELLETARGSPPQLLAQAAAGRNSGTRRRPGCRLNSPLRVDQAGNLLGRQGGMAAQQGQVQAHAQPRILAGQRHRLLAGRLVHHQAGGGEDAFAMGADDRLVDGGGAAEVVGVDDQAAGLRDPACGPAQTP